MIEYFPRSYILLTTFRSVSCYRTVMIHIHNTVYVDKEQKWT